MPPRFYPEAHLNAFDHNSEKIVALALLRTLDEGWHVFHSYPWVQDQGRGLREGEVDFVLVHRKYGLLAVEVKGGRLEYVPDRAEWRQSGFPMNKDPFEQVRRNWHAMQKHMEERVGKLPEFTYGYAVVFPEHVWSGDMPPGVHQDILVGADSLPVLGERLTQSLLHWGRMSRPLGESEMNQVLRALRSEFRLHPIPATWQNVRRDEEILIQLTAEQEHVLDMLERQRRVLVEGVAGTGKTLLALKRASSFAERGRRTLFLCFNANLAEDLRLKAARPNLDIRTFHSLCREVCTQGGVAFEPPVGAPPEELNRWWREEAPNLMVSALDEADLRYDAIVVDEAQDFEPSWWTAIELLLADEDTDFYIFFDRQQNLYDAQLSFPIAQAPYVLSRNCRNTRRIAQACSRAIERPITLSHFAPEGLEVNVQRCGSDGEFEDRVLETVEALRKEAGLRPSQIAILSPRRPEKSSLARWVTGDRPYLGDHPIAKSLAEWKQDKGIWFSTIRAFKGLEAEALILLDLTDFRQGFERSDLYVACSRARHILHAFGGAEGVLSLLRSEGPKS